MSPLEYSISRLGAVLAEIDRLKESEFPYGHSREALNRIEQLFTSHRMRLLSLPPDKHPAISDSFCSAALTDLFKCVRFLGFILRSTNVRNAFEVYGPLLRLCQQALSQDTKLIISSEWEYSPFTFREIPELPNFVLIGLPAPESSNPLLIPLAGHELGHTIWRTQSCDSNYRQKVARKMFSEIESRLPEYTSLFPNQNILPGQVESNIFVKPTIALPTEWALRQCEEYFCDFVGLYTFDQAYLHAAAYLMSPHTAGQRSVLYPNTVIRAKKLCEAASKFQDRFPGRYKVPADYVKLFQNMAEIPDKERHKKFLLSLADAASHALASELMDEAETTLSSANIPVLALDGKERILDSLKFAVPAIDSQSLTNILNAAWDVYHNKDFWHHMPQIKDREHVLKEIVLKNIEVLEIEQILQAEP